MRWRRPCVRPVLERLDDRQLLATFTVTNTGDSGAGSLRQAILDADASGTSATINFNIGSGGTQTITPASALPAVTVPVTIDGTTQPGFNPATGTPIVTIDGSQVPRPPGGTAVLGLEISGGQSTVRGLSLGGFDDDLVLDHSGGDTVAGDWIGRTHSNIYFPSPFTVASAFGLVVATSSNTIGGTAGSDKNIITGSFLNALIAGDHNLVEGSTIGLQSDYNSGPEGFNPPPPPDNGVQGGIEITGSGNTIGGTVAGAPNIIAENLGDGVVIQGGSSNLIEGNSIGFFTNATYAGQPVFGNGGAGVRISGSDNPILDNFIRYNTGTGVVIENGDHPGNSIVSDAISQNGGLGIDLGDDGVTPNHPGGPIPGPNEFQNFPILTAAVAQNGVTTVSGGLASAPNTTYTIQLFQNETPDPSGYGQGATLVGQVTVTTDAVGNASFTTTVQGPNPYVPVYAGSYLSATATDPTGNTSEFSADLVVAVPMADVAIAATASPAVATVGQPVTITFTTTNKGPQAASGVVVTDVVPVGTTLVSSSASQGTVGASGESLTNDIGSLAPGASATLTIVAVPTQAVTFTHTASVSDTSPNEPDFSNNMAVLSVPVQPAPPPTPPAPPSPALDLTGPVSAVLRSRGLLRPGDQLTVTTIQAPTSSDSTALADFRIVRPLRVGRRGATVAWVVGQGTAQVDTTTGAVVLSGRLGVRSFLVRYPGLSQPARPSRTRTPTRLPTLSDPLSTSAGAPRSGLVGIGFPPERRKPMA